MKHLLCFISVRFGRAAAENLKGGLSEVSALPLCYKAAICCLIYSFDWVEMKLSAFDGVLQNSLWTNNEDREVSYTWKVTKLFMLASCLCSC